MPAAPDLLAGVAFLAVAVIGWRRSRVQSSWAALAALTWFLAENIGPAVYLHRPVMLQAALAASSVPRDRPTKALIAVSWAAAIAMPLVDGDWLVLLVAGLMFAGAWRLWRQAATSAQVVALLAAALVLPVVARAGSLAGESLGWPDVVYALLVSLAGLRLLVASLRSLDNETDAAIELTDSAPAEALEMLRSRLGATKDLRARQALTTAVGLLAVNADLHDDLRRQVDEVRASRARLVDTRAEQQRELQLHLDEGVVRHLDCLREVLTRLQPHAKGEAQDLVERCLAEVVEARADVDELVRGLSPRSLAAQGLGAALSELAEHCPARLDVTAAIQRLSEGVEMAVWFACVESVTNAVKHASASTVTIDVAIESGAVVAHIADDGKGGAVVRSGGGLAGLQDRLAVVGGRLHITSPLGEGTKVTIVVPT